MSADTSPRPIRPSWTKTTAAAVAALLVATAVWWAWGRLEASEVRLVVQRAETVQPLRGPSDTVRVLAWNIAHGRGDTEQGILQNWMGGSRADRLDRLRQIADVLRTVDADVVILNEVDFHTPWSHGVDQAAFLARAAGFPNRVAQRNFDFRIPFQSWAFGNALLTRFPITEARWVDLPDHSWWENVVFGSKEAAVVRLSVGTNLLAVVPVHLESRPGDTRLRAVPALEMLRTEESAPLVLGGDFNTAPPGWPETASTTALGRLLDLGWRSPRAEGPPEPTELTFPTYAPLESRDWILVEPSLQIVEARVVSGFEELSDHAPVLAVIHLPQTAGEPDRSGRGEGSDTRRARR